MHNRYTGVTSREKEEEKKGGGGGERGGNSFILNDVGIIFESTPIAIFYLVAETKEQTCSGVPAFFFFFSLLLFFYFILFDQWRSGLHGSDLFRPSCRREMRGFHCE